MGHESRIELWLPLTTVLLVSFRADWLRREGSDENRGEKQPNSLGRHVQRLREWHGRSEPTLFKYVGLEARETPAVGKIFSLDFPLYRTAYCVRTILIWREVALGATSRQNRAVYPATAIRARLS